MPAPAPCGDPEGDRKLQGLMEGLEVSRAPRQYRSLISEAPPHSLHSLPSWPLSSHTNLLAGHLRLPSRNIHCVPTMSLSWRWCWGNTDPNGETDVTQWIISSQVQMQSRRALGLWESKPRISLRFCLHELTVRIYLPNHGLEEVLWSLNYLPGLYIYIYIFFFFQGCCKL